MKNIKTKRKIAVQIEIKTKINKQMKIDIKQRKLQRKKDKETN